MYAVAFDLVVTDTRQHHPQGVAQAYTESGRTSPQWSKAEHRRLE